MYAYTCVYSVYYTHTHIHQRFSKGKILHLCIFVSPNNSILPSIDRYIYRYLYSGIIQIIRHFYIYCNSK